MLRRTRELNQQLYQLLDGLLLGLAFFLAHAVRYYLTPYTELFTARIAPFQSFLWIIFIIVPFGPIFLELQGFYRQQLGRGLERAISQIIIAMLGLALVLGICILLLRYPAPPRSVSVFFAGAAVFLLLARHLFARWLYRHRTRKEALRETIVLAGTDEDIASFENEMDSEFYSQFRVVDRVDIQRQPTSDLVEVLHEYSVSKVIFVAGHSYLGKVEEAIGACEIEGVEVWLLASFITTKIARPQFESLFGHPLMVFRSTPESSWSLWIKELMDRVGSLGLIIALSPLLITVSILVRLTSPGPAIFKQKRAGLHGRAFTMFKFRSMYQDAEQRKAELDALNQMSGPVFKMENDPRITALGRFIRRTSIDELPQLFNVLRGEMSLVGPRPLPLYEVAQFGDRAQRRRLSVKPGLTCLWQISGRNKVTDFEEWVRLDLEYIDRWSLWLDIKILLRTIPAVLFGSGAR